jgi:hypothetical protein
LLFALNREAAQAAGPPLEVLFIGNSYTSVNDLPAQLAALADAAGGRKIQTGAHLVGGCTLERHVQEKTALEKIRARKWDVVVLQDNSLQPILNPQSTCRYARILDWEITSRGAKTVFYLTWARRHIPQMQNGADPVASPDYARAIYQASGATAAISFENWRTGHARGLAAGLNGAYFAIAKELHAAVAPVGPAWQKALAADPRLVLHQSDQSHPTPTGSYLAACVFYATLFHKSPVGLPGELTQGSRVLVQVAPDEAKWLQRIAWQAVQEARR